VRAEFKWEKREKTPPPYEKNAQLLVGRNTDEKKKSLEAR